MLKKITARHFDLTAEMKERAEEEMDRLELPEPDEEF